TYRFGSAYSRLENDIATPKRLLKPELTLPSYDPKKDLELKTTRTAAQDAIASMSTLAKIANTKYSVSDLTNFALLDKMGEISADKRTSFYAKCTQLIRSYRKIVKEKHSYIHAAKKEHTDTDMDCKLPKLKTESKQKNVFFPKKSNKSAEDTKKAISEIRSTLKTQNKRWLKDRLTIINMRFKEVSAQLEAQFTTAKIGAV
ncbi:MAG: hypothetical protein JSS12_08180, partial [Verrucomicrobia bacterium]|nr:hypothetical protein [Verrucomicrobiota bacterium]